MSRSLGNGSLGEVIRGRRTHRGWSQEELAERVSCTGDYVRQSDISRLERGKIGLPRRARLERIAAALDMPLGELLARSGWAGAADVLTAAGASHSIGALASETPASGDGVPQRTAPADEPLLTTPEALAQLHEAITEARLTIERSAEALDRARATHDLPVLGSGSEARSHSTPEAETPDGDSSAAAGR